MEQKCNNSPSSRMGIESVSSTYMPQTGSRTKWRPVFVGGGEALPFAACCGDETRLSSSKPKRRRSARTRKASTSSYNRYRTMRESMVMGGKKRPYKAGTRKVTGQLAYVRR